MSCHYENISLMHVYLLEWAGYTVSLIEMRIIFGGQKWDYPTINWGQCPHAYARARFPHILCCMFMLKCEGIWLVQYRIWSLFLASWGSYPDLHDFQSLLKGMCKGHDINVTGSASWLPQLPLLQSIVVACTEVCTKNKVTVSHDVIIDMAASNTIDM